MTLNIQLETIFALRREKLCDPPPLKTGTPRDMTKYCAFHKDHGQLTFECKHIRRKIEDLIKAGELKKFVLEMIDNANAPACRFVVAARQENNGAHE